MMARVGLLFLAGLSLTTAFVPTTNFVAVGQRQHQQQQQQRTDNTRLFLEWEQLTPAMQEARSNFFIWFFGASGAAGIARSAFPIMYANAMEILSLKDASAAKPGEEMIGLSPLVGYPRDLSRREVEKVLNNPLNIEGIVKKYPVEGNFLSKKGYITYEAFKKGNAKADPLAVRAVFDCFAQSTLVSNPEVAQAKIDSFKQDLNAFKSNLLYSKAVGWAAIVTLLGLLGLADIEAYFNLYNGWFPEWPGGRLWLEGGLWGKETGVWLIPKYWL